MLLFLLQDLKPQLFCQDRVARVGRLLHQKQDVEARREDHAYDRINPARFEQRVSLVSGLKAYMVFVRWPSDQPGTRNADSIFGVENYNLKPKYVHAKQCRLYETYHIVMTIFHVFSREPKAL